MTLTIKFNYLPVQHYAIGLCVGGLERGKLEGGALNYLCKTEVLFKVSLFS
jgi:hypothetical protein